MQVMKLGSFQRTHASRTVRLISIVVASVSLIYALYVGLHGFPGETIVKGEGARISGSAQPWVFGLAFAGTLGAFCVGVALRIDVIVSCALIILGVGSAVLFTSYGLHFAVITAILACLTYYGHEARVP